jgi:two-component system OmpR family sensor kinase
VIRTSIRTRLTVWYTLVLAAVLLITGIVTLAVLQDELQETTDRSLLSAAGQMRSSVVASYSKHGVVRLRAFDELVNDMRDAERPVLILRPDGSDLAASATPLTAAINRDMLRGRVARHTWGVFTVRGRQNLRVILEPVQLGGAAYVIVIAQSLRTQEELFRHLAQAMAIGAPIALLAAAWGGYLLARKSLEPVAAMSANARMISATSLAGRIAVVNPNDELGELATTLNGLLGRLSDAFVSQRRFMADASHELRSPVAILQGELDVTSSIENQTVADYQESLGVMRRTVERLSRIVGDLFLLARSDAGQYPVRDERFYLSDVIVGTVLMFRTLAADRGIALSEEHDDDLLMAGDEGLMQRLLINLVENALRHTPSGGTIRLAGTRHGSTLRVDVVDTGIGISSDMHERVFERFFRVDLAHSRSVHNSSGGSGLGLPIARWIAEIHGGRVWVNGDYVSGAHFVAEVQSGVA